MRKTCRLAALVLALSAAPAEAGYVFTDTVDDVWEADEKAALTKQLAALPDAFRDLPVARIFKTGKPKSAPRHSAPPALFWQLFVSTAGMPRTPRAEYLTLLSREFVHQLLHVHDAVHDLSDSPEWRKQSGWRPREYLGIKIPGLPREADNQDPRGYASDQGLNDAEEDFATFGSVFFVTPDSLVEDSIACRTPGKYAFFKKAFPTYKPYLDQPHVRCRPVDQGFLDDIEFYDPITGKPLSMGPVNADTVEGFELLYATPGVADAAEVAGHLILRMKLRNNPLAKKLGIENPNDLVLSFLADTDAGQKPPPPVPTPPDEQCKKSAFDLGNEGGGKDFDAFKSVIQSLKGLGGGFLTIFDRQTLYQAVKSYTVDQDRNLLRYALKLDDAQKKRLIDQLYLAKKSYRSKYYFFDRNCASILVQLIGEGIGDEEVAAFDPMVVPPNTLVALLIRKGLAAEVHPAFYSYKKKGQFAQEEIKRRVTAMAAASPALSWPNPAAFARRAEGTRTDAYEKLARIAQVRADLRAEIYRVATLGQEAEMAFMDHTQRCEEFSTKPTLVIRRMQKELLAGNRRLAEEASLDTNALLETTYGPAEALPSGVGSTHTNLSSVRLGAGLAVGQGNSQTVVTAGFALHRQDFGATSRQSMQRATFVSLGEFSASSGLKSWTATGLSLRKFKERLDEVPPFFTDAGTFGLGLTVLDLAGGRDVATHGTVAGGELMANLWSSRHYDRFIYASLGAALEAEQGGRYHLALPLRIEGLWTVDDRRDWQLRGFYEIRTTAESGKATRSRRSNASVAYRLGEPWGTELLVRASGEAEDACRLFQLGLEWNRW